MRKFIKGLVTVDFIFYCDLEEGDENGCVKMYSKDMVLISDNIFAYEALSEELEKGIYEYINETLKLNFENYMKENPA